MDDLSDHGKCVQSGGWLLKEDDQFYWFAADYDAEWNATGGYNRIAIMPKQCIKNMELIKEIKEDTCQLVKR